MSAFRLSYPKFRAADAIGRPLAGGQLITYAAGTTTPKTSYADASGQVANTNPVVLDANGEAVVFLDGAYKLALQDSTGATIWTQDNVIAGAAGQATIQNLRMRRNPLAANKVDVITDAGQFPSLADYSTVAIPDGQGLGYRSRTGTYAGGTGSITMADGVNYWGRTSANGSAYGASLYAIWDGAGIVWAIGGQPGLTAVPTTTTPTDPDYLLLEDSTTYVRSAAHFCACVGRMAYEYDAGDAPDNTFGALSFLVLYGLIAFASLAEARDPSVASKAVDPQGVAAVLDMRTRNRNRIINGRFQVDQSNSGAAQTITAGAALAYTVDQFYAACTGANVTGQQITVSGQKRYRFTGAAGNTGIIFGTRMEAADTADLASKIATLQALLSSSSLASITWTAYYANTADTFGTLASPTRTQIATGSFSVGITEPAPPPSAQINMPAGATTGIEIVFTTGALLASQTLTFGDIQLEAGNVATPVECRPYGKELALCQRFYRRFSLTNANGYFGPALAANTTACYLCLPITTMRATPSIDAPAASKFILSNMNGTAYTVSSIQITAASNPDLIVVLAGTTGLVTGQMVMLSGNNDITAYIGASARL